MNETKKIMRRAKRAAQALNEGPAILAFLQKPEMRALLVEGAKEDVPPVSKVSADLLEEFGDSIKPMPVKQFIGMVVKAVLAEEGYELEDTGVRIHDDPLFRSGSTYSKIEVDEDEDEVDDGELLRDVISKLATLSAPQQRRLRELIEIHLD